MLNCIKKPKMTIISGTKPQACSVDKDFQEGLRLEYLVYLSYWEGACMGWRGHYKWNALISLSLTD